MRVVLRLGRVERRDAQEDVVARAEEGAAVVFSAEVSGDFGLDVLHVLWRGDLALDDDARVGDLWHC